MSRKATVSAMGLYNHDNTLFDLMYIPGDLDKDIIVSSILAETAELEIVYPNPLVLKSLIGVWSNKEKPVWDKLYETMLFEYDPIENYNRYEEGTNTETGNTAHSGSDSRAGTDSRTGTSTAGGSDVLSIARSEGGSDVLNMSRTAGGSDSTSGTDTKGHYVAGFDAPTPTEADDGLFKQTRDEDNAQTTTRYGKTESGSDTTNYGKTEMETQTTTYGKTGTETASGTTSETVNYGGRVNETKNGSHTLHMHGNIGVMSTQDMIKQEREIDLFNLYDIIVDGFKAKFCITVY